MSISPSDELHLARSRALEQYSALENTLCMLFAALLKTNPSLAAHVFYKLGAAARNRMLEALIGAVFGNQYDDFWFGTEKPRSTGLLGAIRGLDDKRHQMAHWTVSAFKYPEEQKEKDGVYMVKPEFWATANEPTKLGTVEMKEFITRGAFIASCVIHFTGIAADSPYVGADRDKRQTWLAIFEQPFVYPPPPGHPLAQMQ